MDMRDPQAGMATKTKRIITAAAVALIAVVAAAVIVPLVATSTPDFFSRYHLLERRYVNLENSAHEGIGCRACHETQPVENGLALIGDYYLSFVRTGEQVPAYFTFDKPRREACLACHEDDWATETNRTDRIPHPAHLRVASETRECVECHKWTGHFETYMEKHKNMPFSGVCAAYGCHVGTKTTEQCFDCHHVLAPDADKWLEQHPTTVRESGQASCLEQCHTVTQCQQCHTTGDTPEFEGLPIETSMKAIEELHVKPDWTARYHGGEALKNRANCLLCHQDEGECGECHLQRPSFHGSTETWIGRHSKQTDDVEDPRCIECHEVAYCEDCHRQFKEME